MKSLKFDYQVLMFKTLADFFNTFYIYYSLTSILIHSVFPFYNIENS